MRLGEGKKDILTLEAASTKARCEKDCSSLLKGRNIAPTLIIYNSPQIYNSHWHYEIFGIGGMNKWQRFFFFNQVCSLANGTVGQGQGKGYENIAIGNY